MKKKGILIVGVILILIVVVFAWKFSLRTENYTAHNGVAGDPIDITFDFYASWLASRKGENDSANTNNPLDSEVLSKKLKKELKHFDFSSSETGLDPVLCQTTLPDGFRSKLIFEGEDEVQILVLSSEKGASNQASVSLELHDGLWEISDISCNQGEQAPEMGEFSFDTTGYLLKDSLPSTFDKDYWHLVFTEDDVQGHTAPLILSETSMCIDLGGATNVCKPNDVFQETMNIHVQGQLTEAGVAVSRIEFIADKN